MVRLSLFFVYACCVGAPALAGPLQMRINDTRVSITQEGKEVLGYRYAGVPFKPYADVLATPSGINVLRDAPADHLHHHALMYAVKLNGVNFWEEGQAPGVQAHQQLDPLTAGFRETLEWRSPEGAAIAAESRTLTLLTAPDLHATLLTWASTMKPSDPAATVELTGSHYHGLGMRFLVSMDTGGKFMNANDDPGEIVRGTELLSHGKWCAYQALADGKPVTAAMFDSPENPRPVTWFTMTGSFAYLSATLESHRVPTKLGTLNLKYGVALWDGHVSREEIEAVYTRWLALASEAPTDGGTSNAK